MTNSIRIGVTLLVLFLVSCQRELDFEIEEQEPDLPFRIVKTIAVTDGDTLITEYTYDRSLRLEAEITYGKSFGESFSSDTRFGRDEQGRIVTIQHSSTDAGIVRTTVHYPNATTSEYDYLIAIQSHSGLEFRDSVAFTYANSNMSSSNTFRFTGSGYIPSRKETFVHNGSNNVESSNIHALVNGNLVLVSSLQYTYSNYRDYIWTTSNGAQNYLLTGVANKRHMNVVELRVVDQTGLGLPDIVSSTTLTLDEAGTMALSGVRFLYPQNLTTNLTFYYQYY